MVECLSRDYIFANQQLSLAEMDIENPGFYDFTSFGDRTKMICFNSSQNGSRDPKFCMKIDLALLIPMI